MKHKVNWPNTLSSNCNSINTRYGTYVSLLQNRSSQVLVSTTTVTIWKTAPVSKAKSSLTLQDHSTLSHSRTKPIESCSTNPLINQPTNQLVSQTYIPNTSFVFRWKFIGNKFKTGFRDRQTPHKRRKGCRSIILKPTRVYLGSCGKNHPRETLAPKLSKTMVQVESTTKLI